MARIPTDLQMLNEIFNRYYEAFDACDEDESMRSLVMASVSFGISILT